jgi:hypothetical protein
LGWCIGNEHDRPIGDVDAVDLAALDVVGEHDLAPFLIGRQDEAACSARTQDVAVAVFEIRSFEVPSHRFLLRRRDLRAILSSLKGEVNKVDENGHDRALSVAKTFASYARLLMIVSDG